MAPDLKGLVSLKGKKNHNHDSYRSESVQELTA